MKVRGLWTPEVARALVGADGDPALVPAVPADLRREYRTAFDLDRRRLVASAAARQVHLDQSQSFNVYYAGSSLKELSDTYFAVWEAGLKTSYYLHAKAASGVEKSTCRVADPSCLSCQ